MNQALQYLLEKYGITMTFEQSMQELHCCDETLYGILQRKEISARRAGRKWIIPTESFFNYLNSPPEEEGKSKKKNKLIS